MCIYLSCMLTPGKFLQELRQTGHLSSIADIVMLAFFHIAARQSRQKVWPQCSDIGLWSSEVQIMHRRSSETLG